MNAEQHAKLLGEVNRGSLSRIVIDQLEPHLAALEKIALADLKNTFRSGEFDQVKMLVKIGQLCNLDDIRTRLSVDIRTGENAGRKIVAHEAASHRTE